MTDSKKEKNSEDKTGSQKAKKKGVKSKYSKDK